MKKVKVAWNGLWLTGHVHGMKNGVNEERLRSRRRRLKKKRRAEIKKYINVD